MNPLDLDRRRANALEQQTLRRRLLARRSPQSARVTIDGRELINFGSNDYLGLAADPRLAAAAAEAATARRLGQRRQPARHRPRHRARRLGTAPGRVRRHRSGPGVLLRLRRQRRHDRRTGRTAATPSSATRKNHASLIDGCRLSRADVRVYPHGDCGRLAALLARIAPATAAG